MPAEESQVVVYDSWNTGPWHAHGPEVGPSKGFNYICVNMQLYDNGSLGVRPCLKILNTGDNSIDIARNNFLGLVYVQRYWDPDLRNTVAAAYDKALYVMIDSTATQIRLLMSDLGLDSMNMGSVASGGNIDPYWGEYRYGVASDGTTEGAISTLDYLQIGLEKTIMGAIAEYGIPVLSLIHI